MVLEARENAEKVWYPVVWEEVKDADNVIDYDIRDEETKDTAAMINANNQTTTGMATVIPWVNAPKLLESTSIISAPRAWYIQATVDWNWGWDYPPWEQQRIHDYVLSNEVGKLKFTIIWATNNMVVFPADWTYQIDITYPTQWSFHYFNTRIYDTNTSWKFIDHTWHTGSAWPRDTETVVRDFKKGAKLYAICEYVYVWSWTWADRNPYLTMTITRLW
jgi:hypothetical protein